MMPQQAPGKLKAVGQTIEAQGKPWHDCPPFLAAQEPTMLTHRVGSAASRHCIIHTASELDSKVNSLEGFLGVFLGHCFQGWIFHLFHLHRVISVRFSQVTLHKVTRFTLFFDTFPGPRCLLNQLNHFVDGRVCRSGMSLHSSLKCLLRHTDGNPARTSAIAHPSHKRER